MNAAALPASLLLCIYTCEADRLYLEQLKSSRFYARVAAAKRIRILEVYAEPELASHTLQDGRLILSCPEAYDSLSIKTHAMLDYCHAHFDFNYLLKLDCTLVDYARRPSNRPSEQLNRVFNLDAVERLIFDPDFYDSEYIGLHWQHASRDGIAQWAKVKGLPALDLEQIFGERDEISYYAGKFYALGQQFCGFIARHGATMAQEHQYALHGSEDLMIGRLYERYCLHDQS